MDWIFVILCNLGVTGAALATVLSQMAMAGYIVLYTIKKYPELRFSPWKWKGGSGILKKGASYGTPLAIQNSVASIGNLFLQRFMNGFGEQTVAAITTAYRIDMVLLLPVINLSTAIATMVAQQIGADNRENAKKFFKLGTILMEIIALSLTIIIVLTGKYLLALFGLEAESVIIGERFFRTIAVFYVANGLSMSLKGYLEGIADMTFAGIMEICSLGVRLFCSYLFVSIWNNMVVAYAEGFAWVFLVVVFRIRLLLLEKKGNC